MFTLKEIQCHFAPSGDQRDINILLAESVKKNTAFLYAHPEYRLRLPEYLRWRWFIHRYQRGYSVAAIVGHKEFFGLNFLVNRHVLVPRPETELMVEEVIETLATTPYSLRPTLLIDVGTGSGCIPISILKTSPTQPTAAFAIDISAATLKVARKNAARHSVNIQFLQGNLLEPFIKTYKLLPTNYQLIITANLPYLTREQVASEPSIWREPATALVAEDGGLALYQKLFAQIQTLPGQKPLTILCEIDPSQNEKMTALIKNFFPAAILEIKKDLAGLDRLVVISLS